MVARIGSRGDDCGCVSDSFGAETNAHAWESANSIDDTGMMRTREALEYELQSLVMNKMNI
jgi:hypothetical protein